MNDELKIPNKYKLNPVLKDQIVKTLRSKKYKFTRDTLYDDLNGQYCTLGVVYHMLGVDNEILDGNGSLASYDIPSELKKCVPKVFLDDDPIGNEVVNTITNLNDKIDTKSYRKTATWIEKNL